MIRTSKIFLSLVFVLSGCLVMAQSSSYSPLSGVGIGQLQGQGNSILNSMGNAYSGYHSGTHSNMGNMASLSRLTTTSFEVGFTAEHVNFKTQESALGGWNGNLDYLTLAFPIFNPINDLLNREQRDYQVGMMIGMKPYSSLGYEVSGTSVSGTEKINKLYLGDGGLFDLFYGVGARYKETSIGLKLSYILGKFNYTQTIDFNSTASRYVTINEKVTKHRAFNFELSAQHRFILKRLSPLSENVQGKPSRTLTIGASYAPNLNSSLDYSELFYREHLINPSSTGRRDTLVDISDSKIEGTLAGHLNLGIMYRHNAHLTILGDLHYGFWSAYRDNVNKENLKNTSSFSLGFSYLPSTDNFSSYLSRINYRFGAYYGQDPRVIDETQFSDYGVSAGFTLPFVGKRKLTYSNILLKYGVRGISSTAVERYFSVGIGISATDNNWFIKPKYD